MFRDNSSLKIQGSPSILKQYRKFQTCKLPTLNNYQLSQPCLISIYTIISSPLY